jgi:hypothetical protein
MLELADEEKNSALYDAFRKRKQFEKLSSFQYTIKTIDRLENGSSVPVKIYCYYKPFICMPGKYAREYTKNNIWNACRGRLVTQANLSISKRRQQPAVVVPLEAITIAQLDSDQHLENSFKNQGKKRPLEYLNKDCGAVKRFKHFSVSSGGKSMIIDLEQFPISRPSPGSSDPDSNLQNLKKTVNTVINGDNLARVMLEIKNIVTVENDSSYADRVFGNISALLFQSVAWKLQLLPIENSEYNFCEATADIDQASLTVSGMTKHLSSIIIDEKVNSNEVFISTARYLFIRDLYDNVSTLSSCDTITKQAFMTDIARHKGGSTYMSSKVRQEYHHVFTKKGSDVLNISISLKPTNTKSEKRSDSIHHQQFKEYVTRQSNWFTKEELSIAQQYKDCYHPKDKIWIALKLLSLHIVGRLESIVHRNFKKQQILQSVKEEGKEIPIYGGELFFILLPFQISVLELYYGTSEVSFTMESYGSKLRAAVEVNMNGVHNLDKLKTISKNLWKKNEPLSTSIIVKTSQLFSNQFQFLPRNIDLNVGVGLSYNIKDSKCEDRLFAGLKQPHYDAKQQRRKVGDNVTCIETCDVIGKEEVENDMQNHYDDYESDDDTKFISHEKKMKLLSVKDDYSQWNYSLYDLLGKQIKTSQYWVGGGILGCGMHPFTSIINIKLPNATNSILQRVQHYHVAFREAIGEQGMDCSLSRVAGSVDNMLYKDKVDGRSYLHCGEAHNHIKKFSQAFTQTLCCLKSYGNGCRIEMAYKISNPCVDFNVSLQEMIFGNIKLAKEGTQPYDLSAVVTLLEMYSSALEYYMEVVTIAAKENMMKNTISAYEIHRTTDEIMAHVRTICNGRQRLRAKSMFFGAKFLKEFQRPYLSQLPPVCIHEIKAFLDGIKWKGKDILNELSELGFNFDDVDDRAISICRHCPLINRIGFKVCSKCFKLFNETSMRHFSTHFCYEGFNVEGTKTLSDDDDLVTRYFFNRFESLSGQQKLFVAKALDNQYNMLLLGGAGAGKSTALTVMLYALHLKFGDKAVAVVSQTKNAANIISGVTLHSFFGLQKETLRFNNLTYLKEKFRSSGDKFDDVNKYTKYFVLDEVGLISAEALEVIDHLLKFVKNSEEPFGGIRIILSGDPLQLKPIVNEKDATKKMGHFFFETPTFTDTERDLKYRFKVHYLSGTYRQDSESKWATVLNKIRTNRVKDEDYEYLKNELGKAIPKQQYEHVLTTMTHLCNEEAVAVTDTSKKLLHKILNYPNGYRMLPQALSQEKIKHAWTLSMSDRDMLNDKLKFRCKQVVEKRNSINNNIYDDGICTQSMVLSVENVECNALSSNPYYKKIENIEIVEIQAVDNGDTYYCLPKNIKAIIKEETNLDEKLELATELRVQFTSNSVGFWLANNSQGIIKEFIKSNNGEVEIIKVQPLSDDINKSCPVIEISRMDVSFTYVLNDSTNFQISRRQFPLRPAVACTVYSSLGQTFSNGITAIFNNSRVLGGNFNAGVTYTTLSRFREPSQIGVLWNLHKSDICADSVAVAFDDHHRLNGGKSPKNLGISHIHFNHIQFRSDKKL